MSTRYIIDELLPSLWDVIMVLYIGFLKSLSLKDINIYKYTYTCTYVCNKAIHTHIYTLKYLKKKWLHFEFALKYSSNEIKRGWGEGMETKT
jgi:hypothetical protein